MKGNLGHYLTILGLCALGFYGVMFGCGLLRIEAMPQFVVTAVIFLTAARMMRKVRLGGDEEADAPARREPDWAWLTTLMNWTAALLIIALMAILLMKPSDLALRDALNFSTAHRSFFAEAVP